MLYNSNLIYDACFCYVMACCIVWSVPRICASCSKLDERDGYEERRRHVAADSVCAYVISTIVIKMAQDCD